MNKKGMKREAKEGYLKRIEGGRGLRWRERRGEQRRRKEMEGRVWVVKVWG